MSRRIDNLKQAIKNHIAAREAGFLETIPSIRALMPLFGETRHVVNAALKELETEGVLSHQPQRGFVVNQATRPSPSVAAVDGGSEEIEVIFTETLHWQTAHWTRMIRHFEELHPQYAVKPRFLADSARISEHLGNCHGKPVIIVRTPPDLMPSDGHFIPVPEIERILGEPLVPSAELMPGFECLQTHDSVPYLLQPQMLLIRKKHRQDAPELDHWQNFFRWCSHALGERSILPINTEVLLQRIGLWRQEMPDENRLRSHLELVAELMRFARERKLYYIDLLSTDNFSQIRKILEEPLRVLCRNSFYYGAVVDFCADRLIEFYPLPLEPDGYIDVPVCRLSMAGSACTPGAARFFQFILGSENQNAMLKSFLGVSPFRCWNRQVLEHPEKYPVHLDMVIDQLLKVPPAQLLYAGRERTGLQDFLNCLVTDKLMLPLLSGELTGRDHEQRTIDQICRTIMEKHHELKQEYYITSLRRQLLGGD